MSAHAEDRYEGEVSERRRKLPKDRQGISHKASVGGHEFYLTANTYLDGSIGEVFIKGAGKEGSTVQGLLDAFATMFSIGIQFGAEFDMLARKFAHMKFEPLGYTDNPEIPYAVSMIDYIMRWLALHYGSDELCAELDRIAEEMHPVAKEMRG